MEYIVNGMVRTAHQSNVIHETRPYSLFNNARFYILVSTFLLSVAVVAWQRLHIPSTQLFYIRTEQVFGLLCICYWYLALIISPIGYIVGKQRMAHIEFARRAIGVSAAYFAVVHVCVSLWGQLGGIGEVSLLPRLFKWSLVGGGIALVILLIMAATSFDKVVKYMTFRRWKWLHRLVYIGGTLAVLHVWSIGTHLSYSGVQIAACTALVLLSGLETFRVITLLAKRYEEFQEKQYFYTLVLTVWAVWIVLILSIPTVVQNYHSSHHTEVDSKGRVTHAHERGER